MTDLTAEELSKVVIISDGAIEAHWAFLDWLKDTFTVIE